MTSLIFCTSFIPDMRAWETRYRRWLDYYRELPLNAVKILMIDDGSPFQPPAEEIQTISSGTPLASVQDKHVIIRFAHRLGRQNIKDYPGWWRSFLHSVSVAEELGVDKIIHIESDAFILSQRLADFINQTHSGWHVLWSRQNDFPETAIQVICRDQFEVFARFKASNPEFSFPDFAEWVLPFTAVHREFKGDRYSEMQRNRWIFRSRKFDVFPMFKWKIFSYPVPPDADFATQGVQQQHFAFRGHRR